MLVTALFKCGSCWDCEKPYAAESPQEDGKQPWLWITAETNDLLRVDLWKWHGTGKCDKDFYPRATESLTALPLLFFHAILYVNYCSGCEYSMSVINQSKQVSPLPFPFKTMLNCVEKTAENIWQNMILVVRKLWFSNNWWTWEWVII